MRLDQGQLQVPTPEGYNLHMEVTALKRSAESYTLSVFLTDGSLRIQVASATWIKCRARVASEPGTRTPRSAT